MKVGTIVIAAVLLFAFGVGVSQPITDAVVQWKEARDPGWNKRGRIACVDGAITVSNIDIDGNFAKPVLTIEENSCPKRETAK